MGKNAAQGTHRGLQCYYDPMVFCRRITTLHANSQPGAKGKGQLKAKDSVTAPDSEVQQTCEDAIDRNGSSSAAAALAGDDQPVRRR